MRWLLGALSLVLALPGWGATCSVKSSAERRPLVELYTAEGCNECPPADKWLGTVTRTEPGVSTLSFHVDYWNEDGWVDPFSHADYTQRQKYRVRLANKKALVTPQVMVGANATVDWRSASAFKRALASVRKGAPELGLALTGSLAGDQLELQLSATPVAARAGELTPAILWLALYQKDADSHITAGENRGVNLHHTHVVRRLAGPWKVESAGTRGSLRIPLTGFDPRALGVILFAESSEDADTLESVELPLAMCQ